MSGTSARAAVEGRVAAVQAALASGDTDTGFMLLDALVREWPSSSRVRLLAAALHAEEGFGDLAREHAAAAVANARGDLATYSSMLSLLKLGEPIEPHAFADAHRTYGRYVESMRTYRNPGRARGPIRLLVAGLDAHIALVRFLPSIFEHVPAGVTLAVASLERALLESCKRRWPGIAAVLLPPDPQGQIAAALDFAPDVLLDLAGHGPNNVLHLLASRCAPVQVTWLDYLATTGLETVDGRITDGVSDPPGNEQFHAEALWRLPVPPWSYEPWPESAAIGVVVPTGPPRLGCASVPAKLNARSLALFARVLAGTPGATLTFAGFRSRRAVERVLGFFAPEHAARIECLPRLPVARYLDMLSGLDVVLDTVGFSGGTSTLDALWHGVPVVTQPLVLSHSRSSASVLAHLGQHELVAAGDAACVAAVHRALDSDRADPARRRERHAQLRGSSLGDGRRFAEAFYATLMGHAAG
ncbi:MAG TPA: hypothetical protein VND91_11580 [Candidatus Saccharimonadia bacterium]|nr:hypothetical protein [Candidatus Saccharimonadia bacterium]